jgi:hypothetical protein
MYLWPLFPPSEPVLDPSILQPPADRRRQKDGSHLRRARRARVPMALRVLFLSIRSPIRGPYEELGYTPSGKHLLRTLPAPRAETRAPRLSLSMETASQ